MKTITVSVTQDDIDVAGQKRACGGELTVICPIALAVQRHGYPTATVGISHIWIGTRMVSSVPITLPDQAARFMREFDSRRSVTPISFDIEVPE